MYFGGGWRLYKVKEVHLDKTQTTSLTQKLKIRVYELSILGKRAT